VAILFVLKKYDELKITTQSILVPVVLCVGYLCVENCKTKKHLSLKQSTNNIAKA